MKQSTNVLYKLVMIAAAFTCLGCGSGSSLESGGSVEEWACENPVCDYYMADISDSTCPYCNRNGVLLD